MVGLSHKRALGAAPPSTWCMNTALVTALLYYRPYTLWCIIQTHTQLISTANSSHCVYMLLKNVIPARPKNVKIKQSR